MLLGAADGVLDGPELGMPLGAALGMLLGAADGVLDGSELGAALGTLLGEADSALDGSKLGAAVGALDGITLATSTPLSEPVGPLDGSALSIEPVGAVLPDPEPLPDPETSTESSYGVVPTSVGVLLGAVLGSLDGSELDIEPGAGLGVVVGEPDDALDGSADAMLLGSAVGSAE